MLSIGLLSWRAHETLRKTLSSYEQCGLWSCADEGKIFFNEISEEDRNLASEYGVACEGSPNNLGIWGGMDACAKALSGDVILLLQNDCPVVATKEDMLAYLSDGVELILSGRADMVRLRHRFNQGDGIDFRKFFDYYYIHDLDPRATKYFDPHLPQNAFHDTWKRKLTRLARPYMRKQRIVSIIHLESHPECVAPAYIQKVGRFYIVDSSIINFSEQPLLISKRLYFRLSAWSHEHLRHRTVNGSPVMEHALNTRWWRKQHFKIGVCDEGVFTHNRFDDSWRPEHAAFNAAISVENI